MKKNLKKTVLISVPNTGWIHKHVCMATDRILVDDRYTRKIIRPTHNPYENNLHHIIQQFMEEGHDYWLNIDSDNPPTNNPLDLVSYDKDIIGLPTPVWHISREKPNDRPHYLNVYKHSPDGDGYTEWNPQQGLQKVDAIGTGCFMIARRVFEHPEMRKKPFERVLFPDGRVEKGNDIAFCEIATKQGFEIWAHYDYICRHFNEVEALETIQAFGNFWSNMKKQGV